MHELEFGYFNFIYEIIFSFFTWGYCLVLIVISLISLAVSVCELADGGVERFVKFVRNFFASFITMIFCIAFIVGLFCSGFYVLQNFELDANEYDELESYIVEIRESEKFSEADKVLLNNGISKILEDGKIKKIEVVLFADKYKALLEWNSKQKGISKLKIENKIGEIK